MRPASSFRGVFSRSADPPSVLPSWFILAVLFLLRVPFLLIHHIQEDAFITFRTARHLAEQGDLSFNLHQHFPATTSLLYPLLIAGIDLLWQGRMILGVQLLGIGCVIAACSLAAHALAHDPPSRQIVWLLLSCWPVSLVVSYTGMEVPLLLLALGGAMYGLAEERPAVFALSLLLLPLVRPDAIAYGLVFLGAMLWICRRAGLLGAAGLGVGCALLLIGNRVSSGTLLPTTMRAKEIAYHPSHTLSAVLDRVREVFLHQSFLLPISTSYLTRLAPIILALTIAAFVMEFRRTSGRRAHALLAALAILVTAVPLAYAAGGVIFDWYLYPANWMAMAVVITAGVRLTSSLKGVAWKKAAWVLVGLAWVGMAGLQWTRSLVESTQDYHYRADIGRYLGEISHGQGTLFLEPAGYIPYFSGLRTDDEVGLVSPKITAYMLQTQERGQEGDWWIRYVEQEQPDYIVQRGAFDHFETFEGYTLSPDEQLWFVAHYRLLRRTHYNPAAYHPQKYLKRIFAMGPMPDYLVYQRR